MERNDFGEHNCLVSHQAATKAIKPGRTTIIAASRYANIESGPGFVNKERGEIKRSWIAFGTVATLHAQ
jgi:hypothetical protein